MLSHLRRAFTLIELMVVILMIAVMAGVIVPAYNRFYAKVQFDGAARQVQDVFAFAREQAITHDTTVTVTYDAQRHAFTAQVAPPVTNQAQTDLPVALAGKVNPDGTALQSGETEKSAVLPPDVKVASFSVGSNPNSAQSPASAGQGTGNQLHFLSDGTVESGTLAISSADGYEAQFQIWPATGRLTRMDSQQ